MSRASRGPQGGLDVRRVSCGVHGVGVSVETFANALLLKMRPASFKLSGHRYIAPSAGMVRGAGMRTGSPDMRQMHPRHLHGNVWHFKHTGALERQNKITHNRCNKHSRTHDQVATHSVSRRHCCTGTCIGLQQTQTRLRINRTAQCHAREAHIKSGSPPRAITHIAYTCICTSFHYMPTSGSRRSPAPLARARVSPRPRPRP